MSALYIQRDCDTGNITFRGEISESEIASLELNSADRLLLNSTFFTGKPADCFLVFEMLFRRLDEMESMPAADISPKALTVFDAKRVARAAGFEVQPWNQVGYADAFIIVFADGDASEDTYSTEAEAWIEAARIAECDAGKAQS